MGAAHSLVAVAGVRACVLRACPWVGAMRPHNASCIWLLLATTDAKGPTSDLRPRRLADTDADAAFADAFAAAAGWMVPLLLLLHDYCFLLL